MSQNLKDLSVAELQIKDRELRESLFKLRFQHGIRRLDNPAQLPHITEELWEMLGNTDLISVAPWPVAEADALAQDAAH